MAQSTKRKRFVFHQGKLDRNQKHFQKGKEDNGSHKDFLEIKVRQQKEIQGEDDPQILPHTRLSIVKDNEYIGIKFLWYITKDIEDQLHNKRHRIKI